MTRSEDRPQRKSALTDREQFIMICNDNTFSKAELVEAWLRLRQAQAEPYTTCIDTMILLILWFWSDAEGVKHLGKNLVGFFVTLAIIFLRRGKGIDHLIHHHDNLPL